jgi:hypothetical protein
MIECLRREDLQMFFMLYFLVHAISQVWLIDMEFKNLHILKMVMQLAINPMIFSFVKENEFMEIRESRVGEIKEILTESI